MEIIKTNGDIIRLTADEYKQLYGTKDNNSQDDVNKSEIKINKDDGSKKYLENYYYVAINNKK